MMNEQLKYPVGIQTFEKIIEGGYAYVDKTAYLKEIVEIKAYYYLSRPRQFGKSLLLSTLHAFFEGKRELFKGLAIDSMDVDWTPRPVLHFDLNSSDYKKENNLHELLDRQLRGYEAMYGCDDPSTTLPLRFRELIHAAYDKTGRRVVILVDEFDKPLLSVQDNEELLESNDSLMQGFFGNLKSMDAYIDVAFLTGEAHCGEANIFREVNNLKDISLVDRFADICGWTEDEMIGGLRAGIERLAHKREEDFDTTLRELRNYYGGYLFTEEGSRLFNPYSVLCALDNEDMVSYWSSIETPTFLARQLKRIGRDLPDVNGRECTWECLQQKGIYASNFLARLFKTGYLTIGSYDKEIDLYELRFPNVDVETAYHELKSHYTDQHIHDD